MVSGVDKSHWLVNISPITVGFMVDTWLVDQQTQPRGATEEIHLVFWWKKTMIVGWLWGWTILGMIGWDESYGGWKKSCTIGGLSHYLQAFYHPRWCRISSIHSIWSIFGGDGLKPPSSKQGLFWGTPFSDKAIGWCLEQWTTRRFGISVSMFYLDLLNMIFYVPIV